MTKRRPARPPAKRAVSQSDNKYTFCAGTAKEFTIELRVPVGREDRKKTARLMPFAKHMKHFISGDGTIITADITLFFDVINDLWQEDVFDDEIFPFAIGLPPDDPRLENVSLMDAFYSFMKAFSFIMSGFDEEEVEVAEKKSEG